MDMLLRLIKVASIALLMQPHLAEGQGLTKCTLGTNPCSCETDKGTIQLQSKGSPYTAPDTFNTQYSYLWDPCKDFTSGGTTAGAMQYDGSYNLEIGVHSTAFSGVQDGYAIFSMKSSDGIRTTNVKCVCGPGDTFVYESETGYYIYNLIYTSNNCCPGSPGVITVTVGISAGTILMIAFFSLLIAYFLFGTLFQVFVRKAQGRERIPNVNLWSALPGLIKDGCVFLFTCGRRSGYTQT